VRRKVYEREITAWLCRLAQPDKTFVDIGANIGLTSIPVLQTVCNASAISFEPSPSSLPYLMRTRQKSRFRERWEVVPKAAGDSIERVQFCAAAPHYAAFDGSCDTGRGGEKDQVEILQTTVDTEWRRLGCPPVSLMKIDVEGAESRVLDGSHALIQKERPYIVIEWNRAPYKIDPGFLVEYAISHEYEILSLPNLNAITSNYLLDVHMLHTESYLLVPKPPGKARCGGRLPSSS
jgi:FkbM family methyltransferase